MMITIKVVVVGDDDDDDHGDGCCSCHDNFLSIVFVVVGHSICTSSAVQYRQNRLTLLLLFYIAFKLTSLTHPVIAQLVERRTVVDLIVGILRSLVRIRLAGDFYFLQFQFYFNAPRV